MGLPPPTAKRSRRALAGRVLGTRVAAPQPPESAPARLAHLVQALLLQRRQLAPRHLARLLGPGGVPANPAATHHDSSSILLSAEQPDLDPGKPQGLGGCLPYRGVWAALA